MAEVFARVILAFMVSAIFLLLFYFSVAMRPAKAAEVHIFRGLASPPCCTAMDRLAAQLHSDGHKVTVHHCSALPFVSFGVCDAVVKATNKAIVLIGHSNGGTAAVRVAQKVKAKVKLLVVFDPTRLVGAVPAKVGRAICFCRHTFGLGGGWPTGRVQYVNASADTHLGVATNPRWLAMTRREVAR